MQNYEVNLDKDFMWKMKKCVAELQHSEKILHSLNFNASESEICYLESIHSWILKYTYVVDRYIL